MSGQIFLGYYTANGSQFWVIEILRMENVDTDFYTHTMCPNTTTNIIATITITIHNYKSYSVLMWKVSIPHL